MATLASYSRAVVPLEASTPTAPGSPPDLTNSKSSKSSSFHSSALSDVMGPNDLSHFEDINLDDIHSGAPPPPRFPLPPSPSTKILYQDPRPSVSSARSLSHPAAPTHSFRDLTGGNKSRFPSLKGQVNGALRQQNQPPPQSQLHAPGRSMRRGFTSPSAPSVVSTPSLAAPGRRSRSPSPAQPRTLSSRRSSHNLQVSPSASTPMGARKQSWQQSTRKTVKELEAECDAEDDDEVPEEYMMPNVPISPRPVSERSPTPSAYNSPPSELSPSPGTSRPSSLRSASPAVSLSRFSQPQSPNTSKSESSSMPPPLSRGRTNTWEDTYNALDDDARKVTEALEEFQTNLEREEEIKRQQPTKSQSRKSSAEETRKSSKKTASLPPLRKSDPMIDPLQPSAEKEKHLSRTRPSWLPPKNPKEEQKHLKEYAKIQARVQEAMREQAKKEEAEKLAREKAGQRKAEMWENDLLPKYATLIATPSGKQTYRQLWWTGIPPKVRGQVWKTAIGNELEISETTFNVALEKARNEIRELGDRAFGGDLPQIIERTASVFAELKMFAPKTEDSEGLREEQPLHRDLVDVVLAYRCYRPDVDGLTGVHDIAGLLLLNMSPANSFITLGNLLNRPLPLSFLIRDTASMHKAYDVTLSTLHKKAPQLAERLALKRVEPHLYLQPMFSSLFCDRLPVEHAARLMDVYAIEGDKIVTRAAVGLVMCRETKLYQGEAESVVEGLKGVGALHPDEFMQAVYEAGKSDAGRSKNAA